MAEGGFLPPLVVRIVGDTKELSASLGEAAGETEGFSKKAGGSLGRLQSVGKAALLGIAGAAVGLGAEAVHLGDQWENAHVAMAQAVKNTGASLTPFQAQINATQKKMQSLGYSYADTDQGLTSLIQATGSTQKSLSLMGLTADVARVKQISLASAGVLVAKASEGQGRALKALGININTATGGARALITTQRSLASAQLSAKQALDTYNAAGGKTVANHQALVSANLALKHAQENYNDTVKSGAGDLGLLTKSIGGQAQAYAGTFAGRMQVLKTETEDLGARLGVVLIPKLESLVDVTMSVVDWLGRHSTVAKALAAVVGGVLTVAITAYVAHLAVAAVASLQSFAEMSAGVAAWAAEMLVAGAEALLPFAPIILAVAAVGLAAYELYKHWDTVWGFIRRIMSDAWTDIKKYGEYIVAVALGPIGLAALLLYKNWNTVWSGVKSIVSSVWNFLEPIFSDIKTVGIDGVKTEIAGLRTIWHTAWDAIQTVVQSVWRVLQPIFDAIENAAGKVGGAISKITGIGGKVGGFISGIGGKVGFADGGTAPNTGLYVVGEQGPELVRLPGGAQVTSNAASKRFLETGAGGLASSVKSNAADHTNKHWKITQIDPGNPYHLTHKELEGLAGLGDAIAETVQRRIADRRGNYVAPVAPGTSRNAGSFLGATAAAGGGAVMVHTVLNLDGQTVYDTVQKHSLRHNRRNTSNGLSVPTR
jgi:hypothetical protein